MKGIIADKRGKSDKFDMVMGVIILLIFIGAVAPQALSSLFNTTAFSGCAVANSSNLSQCLTTITVPVWVVTTLGIVGAVAIIYLIWRATRRN